VGGELRGVRKREIKKPLETGGGPGRVKKERATVDQTWGAPAHGERYLGKGAGYYR